MDPWLQFLVRVWVTAAAVMAWMYAASRLLSRSSRRLLKIIIITMITNVTVNTVLLFCYYLIPEGSDRAVPDLAAELGRALLDGQLRARRHARGQRQVSL